MDKGSVMSIKLKLKIFLEDAMNRSYRVGDWDCIIFIVRWVDIVTASNMTARYKGAYDNKTSGIKLALKDYHSITDAFDAELTAAGFRSSDHLTVGDIVLLSNHSLAVYNGECAVRPLEDLAGLAMIAPGEIEGIYSWVV